MRHQLFEMRASGEGVLPYVMRKRKSRLESRIAKGTQHPSGIRTVIRGQIDVRSRPHDRTESIGEAFVNESVFPVSPFGPGVWKIDDDSIE